MNNKISYELLEEALSIIAKITGGYATITDINGKRIKTVNSNGEEQTHLKNIIFDLAKKAGQSGKPVFGMSQLEEGAESWCLPLGDYVLGASNVERIKRNNQLKESLIESLSFIARVAGGEAVVFDREGRRIACVSSDGSENKKFIGNISNAARECMDFQKPIIGKSISVNGAIAARIPITNEFGFGFNNEDITQKKQKLMDEVKKYQYAKYNFSDILGKSPQMLKVKEIAKIAAKSNSNVLIFGETGTGKELFAQSIHNESDRRNKPFVAINCAALPPTLIESNLFGYESGAFTGAKKGGKSGVFERANGGTLFLDEISEMDFDLQAKLLRVLQEREVTRIGGSKVIPVDVRVISSTNKPLDVMVKEGKFRQDLFFRLNVIDINLIPLRNLTEDIPLIVEYTIKKMNALFGKFVIGIDDSALGLLVQYYWPGNVRELLNCIEKAFNVIGNERYIKSEHLSFKFKQMQIKLDSGQSLEERVAKYEKEIIEKKLEEVNGVRARAARGLGISTTTLWRKMKDYKLV